LFLDKTFNIEDQTKTVVKFQPQGVLPIINGLYGDALPKMGPFLRLEVWERGPFFRLEVWERGVFAEKGM